MNIAAADIECVGELLGRTPRGLQEIAVRGEDRQPVVIRVASLVDDKPFPTLFWLVCPSISYRIDQLEAAGLIAQLQQQVNTSADLQENMRRDHVKHIALRNSYMSADVRNKIEAAGYTEVFQRKGIGGIGDFSRIRCLHTWYAAHLVVPNTIGRLLEHHWSNNPDPVT